MNNKRKFRHKWLEEEDYKNWITSVDDILHRHGANGANHA